MKPYRIFISNDRPLLVQQFSSFDSFLYPNAIDKPIRLGWEAPTPFVEDNLIDEIEIIIEEGTINKLTKKSEEMVEIQIAMPSDQDDTVMAECVEDMRAPTYYIPTYYSTGCPHPAKVDDGRIINRCRYCEMKVCEHDKGRWACPICTTTKCPHGHFKSYCTICNKILREKRIEDYIANNTQ